MSELRPVGGGKHLTTNYSGISSRHGADSVVFPAVRMSERPDGFLSPTFGNDPLPFAAQILRSSGQ